MTVSQIFAPGAKPDDGCLHAVIIRRKVSRIALIKVFLALEKGTHVRHDAVEYYKVSVNYSMHDRCIQSIMRP